MHTGEFIVYCSNLSTASSSQIYLLQAVVIDGMIYQSGNHIFVKLKIRQYTTFSSIYSWPLNNAGLNCVGPLTCGLFSINTVGLLFHIYGWEPMNAEGQLYVLLFYAILYQDLSFHGFLYPRGLLEPMPCGYRRPNVVKFLESYMQIFDCEGVGTSKSTPRPVLFKVNYILIYIAIAFLENSVYIKSSKKN